MKKVFCLLLITVFLCSLAACSDNSGDSTSSSPASSPSSASSSVSSAEATADSSNSKTKIDVDLTKMNSTMVYSEVQNMMQKPDDYVGKVVKMKGAFSVTEVDGNRYFACIIKDATACCSSGIEFVWKGNHTYPRDYPQEDQEITVTGTFNTYMEGKDKYVQLKDSRLVF